MILAMLAVVKYGVVGAFSAAQAFYVAVITLPCDTLRVGVGV